MNTSNRYTIEDDEIINILLDNGYRLTTNPKNAIYVLSNGEMVDGEFNSGNRGEDHRMIECVFEDIDRYDRDFWSYLHERTGIVMLVPETGVAMIMEGQKLTKPQNDVVSELGYQLEEYCKKIQHSMERE